MRRVEEASFGIIPLIQEKGEWKVLLILHQKGHHWAFPKGHGVKGESALETAKRELEEETGLRVHRLLQETPLTERYQFHRKGEMVYKTVSYFPAVVEGEIVLQEEEIKEYKWVPLKEAVRHLTFREARQMCEDLMRKMEC